MSSFNFNVDFNLALDYTFFIVKKLIDVFNKKIESNSNHKIYIDIYDYLFENFESKDLLKDYVNNFLNLYSKNNGIKNCFKPSIKCNDLNELNNQFNNFFIKRFCEFLIELALAYPSSRIDFLKKIKKIEEENCHFVPHSSKFLLKIFDLITFEELISNNDNDNRKHINIGFTQEIKQNTDNNRPFSFSTNSLPMHNFSGFTSEIKQNTDNNRPFSFSTNSLPIHNFSGFTPEIKQNTVPDFSSFRIPVTFKQNNNEYLKDNNNSNSNNSNSNNSNNSNNIKNVKELKKAKNHQNNNSNSLYKSTTNYEINDNNNIDNNNNNSVISNKKKSDEKNEDYYDIEIDESESEPKRKRTRPRKYYDDFN